MALLVRMEVSTLLVAVAVVMSAVLAAVAGRLEAVLLVVDGVVQLQSDDCSLYYLVRLVLQCCKLALVTKGSFPFPMSAASVLLDVTSVSVCACELHSLKSAACVVVS